MFLIFFLLLRGDMVVGGEDDGVGLLEGFVMGYLFWFTIFGLGLF